MKKLIGIILIIIFVIAASCQNKNKKTGIIDKQKDSLEVVKENKMAANVPMQPDSLFNEQGEKYIFKGIGTEPFWNVEITEKNIYFKMLRDSTEKFVFPLKKADTTNNFLSQTYTSQTEKGSITVKITEGECSDDMSDKKYAQQVQIDIHHTEHESMNTYGGCGNYLVDSRLTDKWVLESMDGKEIRPNDYSEEIPRMEIQTNKNEFTGFAGCNTMNGQIHAKGHLIQFRNIITTKMMCPSQETETLFLKYLQEASTFTINDRHLFLSQSGKQLLTFIKVN